MLTESDRQRRRRALRRAAVSICVTLWAWPIAVAAQAGATLAGRVTDPSGGVIPNATVSVHHAPTNFVRSAHTDSAGRYQIDGLQSGLYDVTVRAAGFQTRVVEALDIDVAQALVHDFELRLGDISDTVTVVAQGPPLDRATMAVGQVIDSRTVQSMPLNGRYFLDLGALALGSVTASQAGFSTTPSRGLGALAINTAGNREDAVNYLVNGITLNNLAFNSISFQPSIETVDEFRIDNSTFRAEYGQSSGAIANVVTRSGSNDFRGGVFEFFRDAALDARNFFNFTSSDPEPFRRNQFGGHAGGPLVRDRAFFFVSFEGLRQTQGVTLNSVVLTDAERAAAVPGMAKLVALLPHANLVDSQGVARFVGTAVAPTESNQCTVDLNVRLRGTGGLHGYYARQDAHIGEPNRNGNTIPGFGHVFDVRRQLFTLSETRVIGQRTLNEARFGLTTTDGGAMPATALNPADFGIRNGITQPIGLPQIAVGGTSLNFGGPASMPSGREDRMFIVSDALSRVTGRHAIKVGGQFSLFQSDAFARDTGRINFPTVASFLAGVANAFSITLGDRTSHISQGAMGFFAQDTLKWRPGLTLEAGVRYEWNMTPTERDDRFIVFDAATASLLRVGRDIDQIYASNNRNVEPRVGLVWDRRGRGTTVVRTAFAVAVDEPQTNVVAATAGNPPQATPLTYAGTLEMSDAIDLARAASLAPVTVDHGYRNSSLRSWNVNVQQTAARSLDLMVGYFGSAGRHLRLARNINQPVDGVRPFAALSPASPILAGVPLGNITQNESSGSSSYHALWVSATRRLSRGLQLRASYTLSKSLDVNSLSAQGVVVQNGYDIENDRGLSDFDARHRAVVSAIYRLPFVRNAFVRDWELALIVQAQSGNPVNIVTGTSTLNGVPNTVRPNQTGPIVMPGTVEQWFDTTAFAAANGFGNLGRNRVIGPRFDNTDLALSRSIRMGADRQLQLRVEAFNLFNHANFGQPGNVVGTPSFARITSTRFATGESGSSRQVQLAVKFGF